MYTNQLIAFQIKPITLLKPMSNLVHFSLQRYGYDIVTSQFCNKMIIYIRITHIILLNKQDRARTPRNSHGKPRNKIQLQELWHKLPRGQ